MFSKLTLIFLSIFFTSLSGVADSLQWISSPSFQSLGNKTFQMTAKAAVDRSLIQVSTVALDYNHYVADGVPTVLESHIVTQNENKMIVWFSTSVHGISSKYYLEVTIGVLSIVDINEVPGQLISWKLVNADPSWPYPSDNSLKDLNGSLSLQSSGQKTIITYNLVMRPNSSLPDFMIKLGLQGEAINEAKFLFGIMAQ